MWSLNLDKPRDHGFQMNKNCEALIRCSNEGEKINLVLAAKPCLYNLISEQHETAQT